MLEDIRKRNIRRKEIMVKRENEYELIREVEYAHLAKKSVEDMEYTLSLIDKYKEALERIVSKGPDDVMRVVSSFREWQESNKGDWPDYVYDIANRALEKE